MKLGKNNHGDNNWFDLTSAQAQIYLGEKSFGPSPLYHLTFAYQLPGGIDIGVFNQAFRQLVREAECLRLRFYEIDGRPVQTILPESDLELQITDYSSLPDPDTAFSKWISRQAHGSVEIDRPINGSWLAILHQDLAIWVISLHHIVSDAWGLHLLFKRVKTLYSEMMSGKEGQSQPLPSFWEFIETEHKVQASEEYRQDQKFWNDYMDTAPGSLRLYGKPSPAKVAPTHRILADLDPDTVTQLRELASAPETFSKNNNITYFNLLLTALAATLYRVSSQTDFNIGVTYMNRPGLLREIPGLMMEVNPLKIRIQEGATFRNLLHSIRDLSSITAKHSHLTVPNPGNRVYNVRFNFHNRTFDGGNDTELWAYQGFDIDDISFNVLNPDFERGEIKYTIDLSSLVFNHSEGDRFAGHFNAIFHAMIDNPDQPIGQARLFSDGELDSLLREVNPPPRYKTERFFTQMFAESADLHAQAVAVESAEGRLTYRQIDELSSKLAGLLQNHGACTGKSIGVYLPRSLEMIIGMLAVFKSGAAYVPLDPTYPDERLAYIINDSGVSILLTREEMPPLPIENPIDRIFVTLDQLADLALPASNSLPLPGRDDTAYLTYTSGTTGRPKGIEVSHGALSGYLEAVTTYLDIQPGDRFLYFAALGFDASYEEIIPTLLSGATVVIRPDGLLSLSNFSRLLDGERISIVSLPTAYWGEWVCDLSRNPQPLADCLRMVLVYAEEPSVQCYREWMRLTIGRSIRWINTYGPSEAVVTTTVFEPVPGKDDPELWTRMPIGKCLPNHQVYILDNQRQPVPLGVPGEIFIGGSVGQGYRNKPQETEAAFLPDPFQPNPESRMYATGDYGRYLPDGQLEFLGRIDNQVKLFGFRIELEGIENRLRLFPDVADAVVVLKSGQNDTRKLVGYLTNANGHNLQTDEIKKFLCQSLPEYMIPAELVILPRLPLTPNGKVNRQALQILDSTPVEEVRHLPAQSALEAQLCLIWGDILGTLPIGSNDNFFDLGGNSILGLRLFSQIEHKLGISLPVSELYASPTVAQLADYIESHPNGNSYSPIVMIRPGGPGLPLFLVHGWGGGVIGYANLAKEIDAKWPIFGIQAAGLTKDETPDISMEAMVKRYIQAIKTIQPHGPYRLGGYCFGGVVAYATACSLTSQGDSVDFVAIIDGEAPHAHLYRPPIISRTRIKKFSENLPFWISDYRKLGMVGIRQRFKKKRKHLQKAIQKNELNGFQFNPDDIILDDGTILPDRNVQLMLEELKIGEKYLPESYPGKVLVIAAKHPSISKVLYGTLDPSLGWDQLARGGVTVRYVEAAHHNIHLPPFSSLLAKTIQDELEQIETQN